MNNKTDIVLTDEQKIIIRELDHPIYTVEYIQDFINKKNTVSDNPFIALAVANCTGFFIAIEYMEKRNKCEKCFYGIKYTTVDKVSTYSCRRDKCKFKQG